MDRWYIGIGRDGLPETFKAKESEATPEATGYKKVQGPYDTEDDAITGTDPVMASEQMDPDADPDCGFCKGKGWTLVRLDEDDVDKDPCHCVTDEKKNAMMKMFGTIPAAGHPTYPAKSFEDQFF